MAGKTSQAGIVVREACEKFPDTPTRTLARMLKEQRPKLFPNISNARTMIQYHRGNAGGEKRGCVAAATMMVPAG